MSATILVTGAAGYIGSHTCVELLAAGFDIVAVDNFCNSKFEAIRRVQELAGRTLAFHEADVRDQAALDGIFSRHRVDAVIHFAALKAVGESVAQPLRYYENNVVGTLTLLEAMRRASVRQIVFSSSATVYGDPAEVPIREDFPIGVITNPYGRSKRMMEEILEDLSRSEPGWRIGLLRYFNPVGAHASGRIGEDPNGTPNNLMPYISQVAVGKLARLSVFGGDYPTPDGTGVRDYIHVVDLAIAHVKAVQALATVDGVLTVNVGTGQGCSVLDMIKTFSRVSGRDIPYQLAERRAGDIACCYADPGKAERVLGWKAERTLEDMCRDSWRWQQANPRGYEA
ncbi:UDP-glucose 4-epimerase GalE [Chromobacterium sphagni]|uniref:UDP-glucose 4-epimerase n=1 Tax=Chromobacterium sphagni TaxID=1903179 RepID=A0A1S1X3S7_9NEIS|nr:UDP-glucose 4-epimerase GalE [Chromobacterium sphagni]OHX14131.1 UDP-glucose 4-epimerase GalE [Chromobacterium sphagni]OHX20340.1 UDP-glucose 4-epimerase GalE [Chromobacterium sphagni]